MVFICSGVTPFFPIWIVGFRWCACCFSVLFWSLVSAMVGFSVGLLLWLW